MGVPKFYRWISERYPCLSEVVKEHQVPEFDNLYLDMNGIIHNCSHPNDDDPHFRISEEQIFSDIFRYIEALFRIIRPRKTFFMAVDGVAPRAKMNQQRGRRFRSAKEAEENIKLALSKGEKLPTEKRFDSNCITPGTLFMEKLQHQLEYFVQNKITYDRTWQGVNVYLSGHQTPGEGEHKIMEYIRYCRSQPSYNPNTRHCLYGLDADLMMLALCSHEPHFSLLREEVRFTKRKDTRTGKAEETTFHLLHISLMREYIDHEFEELKTTISFPYNIESIIDDWVLMGFLVGNDFIPHLPDFHIASNALPLLYQTYLQVLPQLDGYINEGGLINLKRFQAYLKALASFDEDHFEEVYEDYKWLESRKKSNKDVQPQHPMSSDSKTNEEKSIEIVKNLAISQGVYSLEEDRESLEKDCDEDLGPFYREFKQHKRQYYSEKFNVTPTDEQIQSIAFEYILGIQWICHYYYNGVQSWGWYYPYHYSPFVSDLKELTTMKLKYKMMKPFLPFEQLLAVLPVASKDCIPEAYWHLMDEKTSEIGDFYPTSFTTDLNGKKQEWEAVVLIPFIDESRLLSAMQPCFAKLMKSERVRNQHGPCQLYAHDPNSPHLVKSTLPGVFADIELCSAKRTNIPLYAWSKISINSLVKGLLPGCDLSVYYQGIATLYHLPHSVSLKKQSVKVFQAPSRNENMILTILDNHDDNQELHGKYSAATVASESLEETARRLLGKSVFVNWPHMEEAKVVAVSDGKTKFHLHEQVSGSYGSRHKFARKELTEAEIQEFDSELLNIHEQLLNRRGIEIGECNVLIYGQILLGCKYVCGRKGEITLDKQWSTTPQAYALKTAVMDLSVKGPTFETIKSLDDLFPKEAEVFNLSIPHYGSIGRVLRIKDGNALVKFDIVKEPDLSMAVELSQQFSTYHPGYRAAKIVGISPYMLSRITGSIYIFYPAQQKWNVGLSLKFTKEKCGIAGFTKRENDTWLYSDALVQVVKAYNEKFPEVFRTLEKRLLNGSEEQLSAEDVFGSENTLEELKSLTEWMKSLPCAKGRKIHEKSSVVSADTIQAVTDAVAAFKNVISGSKLSLQLAIPPRLLYRPMTQQGSLIPDKHAKHSLLDRVVNVRMGYTVPLGYRGTIVGIHLDGATEHDIMYDIVFDDEFLGGLTLGGHCPERRGYKMPSCALINLSHGERIVRRQANRPVAVVKPHHQGADYKLSSPHHSNQPVRGQLVHSPHSPFVPTNKSVFRGSKSQPAITLLQKDVQSVKSGSLKVVDASSLSSINMPTHSLPGFESKQSISSFLSPSSSLQQAASSLPIVKKSPVKSSHIHTLKSSPSILSSKKQEEKQTRSEDQPSSSATSPKQNTKKKAKRKPEADVELSNALKSALKINNKQLQSPSSTQESADLQKFMTTLKLNSPPPSGAPQKQFSLVEFLASQPPSAAKYPIYTVPQPQLLTPKHLLPSLPPQEARTNNKEAADKLLELLKTNNEEKMGDDITTTSSESLSNQKFPLENLANEQDGASSSSTSVEDDESSQTDRSLEVCDEPNSSVEKLSMWCQRRNLPQPSYAFNSQHSGPNNHMCTVKLWNGAAFTSLPAANEEACKDGAALMALIRIRADKSYSSYPIVQHSIHTSSASTHANHPMRPVITRGHPAVSFPYMVGIPPPFPIPGLPPPPLNFVPMAPDGVIMYPPPGPPPPIMAHAFRQGYFPVENNRFIRPVLPSASGPPLAVGATNPPPTVPQFYPAQVLLSQQSDSYFMERNPRMANTFPFIPSQVMAQHYSAVSSSCDVQAVSDSQRSGIVTAAQVQAPAPTVVKASSQQGRRPKGKLAISFAGKPN